MSAPTSTVEPSTPTAPAPGATQVHPTPNPNSNSNANINGNSISASAATSVSSPSPAPSSSLATTPAPDATHVPAPSASSAAVPPTDGATPAPSTCGVCKQAINQPGFKTCVRCRVKRNAARKRRLEQRRVDTNANGATGNGSVPGTGASTPLMGLNLEEGTEGSVASEGDVAMEHEEDVSTREGSHAQEEEEEEEMSPWDKKRTTLLAAATATLGGAAVAMAESSASAGAAALMTTNNTALAAAALDEESDGAAEDYASDVEMKDESASRALSPPTPSPPLPPPVPASAPAIRPPLDVARLDAEFERREAEILAARARSATSSTPAPAPLPPVASASAPTGGIDGAPCTVCKGPRDNAKYKTCAACRARSRESWRRQSAKRKALAATGGQPTPASSARPTPATSRANSPVHVQAPIPAPTPVPAAGAMVTPIPVYVPPPPDPGAPVPGGTIISGVNVGPGPLPITAPVLAPIPISTAPTPSVDPEKQRRLCSSCRSALAPPRYRTCEHCRWIARREAATGSGQVFTEAEPPTSRLGARRGRKRLNPQEPRVERVGKKRRVLFEVDEDEYTFEREALDVVRDVLRGGGGAGEGGRDVRVTWAVVAGEKGGFGRLARLERVAEAMRSKGIPISPDSEEQEPGSSPYAGPDAVTERWTCTCAQSKSPESAEEDAMDVDTHNETCGGYVYVSCSWDTHSHPAHLRGQRVTIVVVHEQLDETVGAPAMLEAPTPVIEEA
ncbi:hypothetical protein PENSPDRAFT_693028 [Peniophora sp. CONT]|nr:hypothetical protein PENSPDRAFT_693028 [Peniophora sp. CONT]